MTSRKYQPRRNRVTAAALAFFLGGFGVHKFYLRQKGIGILMLVTLIISGFRLLPFYSIFGVFEAIRLLNMTDQNFDRKYNRYSGTNRKDDYLEQRRERQVEKSRGGAGRGKKRKNSRRQAQANRQAISKANPFKNSGIKKYKDYDLEGAIEDFARGLDINKNDVALHFNIACAYSMTEKKDKAYYHLAKAVELGFKDFEIINKKDDLAFVRIQPEYDEFKTNGYKLSTQHTPPSNNSEPEEKLDINDDVLLSQLNKLAELRKRGLLSLEEFGIERKKLLRR